MKPAVGAAGVANGLVPQVAGEAEALLGELQGGGLGAGAGRDLRAVAGEAGRGLRLSGEKALPCSDARKRVFTCPVARPAFGGLAGGSEPEGGVLDGHDIVAAVAGLAGRLRLALARGRPRDSGMKGVRLRRPRRGRRRSRRASASPCAESPTSSRDRHGSRRRRPRPGRARTRRTSSPPRKRSGRRRAWPRRPRGRPGSLRSRGPAPARRRRRRPRKRRGASRMRARIEDRAGDRGRGKPGPWARRLEGGAPRGRSNITSSRPGSP